MNRWMLVVGAITLIMLSVAVHAEAYGSASYVTRPQYQPSFQTYYGSSVHTYWPILDEKEQCKNREDFALQVAPGACQPAVVRSDLLAEQNVPVFCQIDALKVNPLLDVKEIRSIRFDREYAKGVAATGFHPARAALRTRDRLLGDPLLNNIGYAVVVLQKQERESELPETIEVNLTGEFEYDAGNALGIGRAEFVLEEQNDAAWADEGARQSFWNGKYFIRLLSADDTSATVALYRGDQQMSSVRVERGKRSHEIFIPGSYCRAALYMDYAGFEAAQPKARLALTNANSTDVIDVYEGSRVLGGQCTVGQIRIDNASAGTGNVTLRCSSGSILLQLRNRGHAAFEVFVDSDGQKVFPVREGSEYLVTLEGQTYNLTAKSELYVLQAGAWVRVEAVTSGLNANEVRRLREAIVAYRALDQKEGGVQAGDLFVDARWDEVVGVEGNFSAALDAFERVVRSYPAEKQAIDGRTYGQQALQEGIALAGALHKEQQRLRLLHLYVDTYPAAPESIAYRGEIERGNHIDYTNAVAALERGQKFHTVRLVSLHEPLKTSRATLAIGARTVTVERGAVHEFSSEQGGKKHTLTVQTITADSVSVSTTCPRESIRNYKGTLRVGESMVVCGEPVVLQKLDVERVARIALVPQAWGTETKTNVTVRIGIEKRAIPLAPNATLGKIAALNESIRKWEQISTSLGNVVSGLKGACFATAGVLTAKNFVTGLSGSGLARQQVMRGERGWTARCQAAVSAGNFKSLDACFSHHANDISRDVEVVTKVMQEDVNGAIKNVEAGVPKTEGIFSSSLDTSQAVPKYRAYLLEKHGDDEVQIKDRQGARTVKVKELLANPRGYEDGEYSYESLRSLHTNLLVQKSGGSETLKANAAQQLEMLGSGISVNHALTERYKAEQTLREQGFAAPFTAKPRKTGQDDRYVELVPVEAVQAKRSFMVGEGVTRLATVVVPPSGDPVTGEEYSGGTYVLGVEDVGDGAHTVRQVFKKEGEGAQASYSIHEGDTPAEISPVAFSRAYGIGTLYSQQQLTYFNKYENPEVKFYDREPYKGLPAIVPVDLQRGWYVGTKQTLPVFGGIGAYDASGRPTSFWLCNVGANRREQFFEGLGDDVCEMVNLQSGQPLNKFPGLSDEESRALIRRAREALEQAARQHGNSRVSIAGTGEVKVGRPAVSVPSLQCQDFMSPGECNLLFNVCDPVICPATRCDFGGKYPVADVIQTGVIGSTLLCLPNFPEVKVPVCLTGIHAGIDGYVSILKAHRDCLQESVKSGKLVGICDQLYSIYTCEFFWRQMAPLAKVLVPRLLETAYGQNVRGGGEYLTVMGAWQNTQQSINYFTQVYGVNSFKAFQARSVEEVGGEFCKSFISARAPTSLKTVLAPDSPPQFHAYFSSVKFNDATVPATAQYSVYYHLYAGKDQGTYYRVYLKSPPDSSYYAASPMVHVASGFVKKGEYKDEKRDFTAPEGYQELCVNVNGDEKCGFKQVSTSFAANYVRDAIVADQIKESTITSEAECISGGTSATALLNPNLQQGAQEAVSPQLYRRGVIRICATENPGTGTDPGRFVPVGRCDGEKVQCWLDKRSVDNAITDNNRGVKNETLQALEKIQRENLEKGGVILDDRSANAELDALRGSVRALETSFEGRRGGGVAAHETRIAQAVLGRADAMRESLVLNHHRAELWYLVGKVHAALAQQLHEDAAVQRTQASRVAVEGASSGAGSGSGGLSASRAGEQGAALQIPADVPLGNLRFELDFNPANDFWGFDKKISVYYDHVRQAWVGDSESAGLDDKERIALLQKLQGADFAFGIAALLERVSALKGEIKTPNVLYRAGTDDFQVRDGKGLGTFAYRAGVWQHYDAGLKKFVTVGVPAGPAGIRELWNSLQGLDRTYGAALLFAFSDARVYGLLKEASRAAVEGAPLPAEPIYYTAVSGTTPEGDKAMVVHAGGEALGIYILTDGRQVFVQHGEKTEVVYVGRTDDQLNFVIDRKRLEETKASLGLQQQVMALHGKRYRHLLEGSIVVTTPVPSASEAAFQGTIISNTLPGGVGAAGFSYPGE